MSLSTWRAAPCSTRELPTDFQRRRPRTNRMRARQRDNELLDEALDRLEAETPNRVTRIIRRLRSPEYRWVRLPLGIMCIVASFFWFLPVVGIEFLPIGLLLIAQDVPSLRGPAARLTLWLEDRWITLRRRLRSRYARTNRTHGSRNQEQPTTLSAGKSDRARTSRRVAARGPKNRSARVQKRVK